MIFEKILRSGKTYLLPKFLLNQDQSLSMPIHNTMTSYFLPPKNPTENPKIHNQQLYQIPSEKSHLNTTYSDEEFFQKFVEVSITASPAQKEHEFHGTSLNDIWIHHTASHQIPEERTFSQVQVLTAKQRKAANSAASAQCVLPIKHQ